MEIDEGSIMSNRELLEFIQTICKRYPGCIGCFLVEGQPCRSSSFVIVCETGMDKKSNVDEQNITD